MPRKPENWALNALAAPCGTYWPLNLSGSASVLKTQWSSSWFEIPPGVSEAKGAEPPSKQKDVERSGTPHNLLLALSTGQGAPTTGSLTILITGRGHRFTHPPGTPFHPSGGDTVSPGISRRITGFSTARDISAPVRG